MYKNKCVYTIFCFLKKKNGIIFIVLYLVFFNEFYEYFFRLKNKYLRGYFLWLSYTWLIFLCLRFIVFLGEGFRNF